MRLLLALSQLNRGEWNRGGRGLSLAATDEQPRSLNMLLLRDSVVVLGLGVPGDATVAVGGGGGGLFSLRGVAGGSACGCARCRCGGRHLGSGVDSLGLAAAAAGDDGTLVRGRASFVAAGLHLGVAGAAGGFTFTSWFPGFCRRLP